MDQATTTKTAGIANRANLMASPISSLKVDLLPAPLKKRWGKERAEASAPRRKISYFVQPI
jgi:hypothetical protein